MHPLHQWLQNSLTRERDAYHLARLTELFPELQSHTSPHFLALRRYIHGSPERFFDRTAYRLYSDWLQNRCGGRSGSQALLDYISSTETEISRALLFLREFNAEEWHDRPLRTSDEYDYVRFIDKYVHPTYLRLVEAVLAPLARPVAYFSRLDTGRGTEGLDIWTIYQELARGKMNEIMRSYSHIIRNGIGHGGITYLHDEIRYCDKKGNEETFSTVFVVQLFDDLLDTCNGLAAALKVFLLLQQELGYAPPRELLVEELQEVTWTPWWAIEGCLETKLDNRNQLIVYAKSTSRDQSKVQWSTIQSGILAEFFSPGYDRYFLSLRCPKEWSGWAAFDGNRLRELREAGANELPQYTGIIEDGAFFIAPVHKMPRFLGKLDTFLHVYRVNWPLIMGQLRRNLGIPPIACRNAKVHRNAWGAVIDADVVIEGIEGLEIEIASTIIRKSRRRILKAAIREARRSASRKGAAYLPVGYADISVFGRDYRRRRLSGFGLAEDLICRIRFQRIRRIKSPFILGATIEAVGKWRIAWNKAWLEAANQANNDIESR